MNRIFEKPLKLFDNFAKQNPFTWVYGLGRTLVALSTIITLLFSSEKVLFDEFLFMRESLFSPLTSLNFFALFGYEYLFFARVVAILILFTVISGWYPIFTGVLHWWITYSYFHAGAIIEGGDQIASVITLCLIPVTLLDKRKNHWYEQDSKNLYFNFIGNLSLLLISVQMSFVYFHAAVEKMYKVAEWVNGTAVYYYFKDNLFGYSNWMNPLLDGLLTSKFVFFITWGTLFLELLLSYALFMPKHWKRFLLPFGLLFHFLIIVIFGLVSFFFSMAGGLVLYLLPMNTPLPQRIQLWFQNPSKTN